MTCLEELDDVFISLEMAIKFNTAVESGVILKEFKQAKAGFAILAKHREAAKVN